MDGAQIVAAAQELILDELAGAPEGLTNAELGKKTGLNPPIKNQNGYITWTLLQHLRQTGKVVKDGRKYTLAE